ncbi:MAG: SIMPL domain-containing protein, partial [Sphingomicrobium sp.]
MRFIVSALLASATLVPVASVSAQVTTSLAQPISGTRLDISATGEATRVPDVAIISAGVTTQATTATDALGQNAARMERVRAALKRAGIADRDIQTASISLQPQYKYVENQPQLLVGYQASNQLSVKFRDIRASGRILDAL